MRNVKFKGKYVPDRNGKLKPVLRYTDININLPESACRYRPHPGKSPAKAWYNKIWDWFAKNFLS